MKTHGTKAERTNKNYSIGRQVFENDVLYKYDRRKNVIDQLRQIMKDKGIRNTDIAIRMDTTEASISRLMKGDQNMTLDTLFKLSDSVEASLSFIFDGTK